MKKLLNNKEIRKLILGVIVVTISIYLVFFGLFALMGETMNRLQINQLHNTIIHVEELKWEDNQMDNTIAVIEAEIEKMEFIAQLKDELRIILLDRERFNVDIINEEHLYFMESQRAKYEIPKHIYYRLIFAESGFRMFDNEGNILRSNGGAMGYMQILGSTFEWINDRYGLNLNDITNPFDNIIAGTFYLNKRKENIDEIFPNVSENYKWKLTIASYNAGLHDVVNARGIPTVRHHTSSRFKKGDVNTETMAYVNFVTRNFISDEELLAML